MYLSTKCTYNGIGSQTQLQGTPCHRAVPEPMASKSRPQILRAIRMLDIWRPASVTGSRQLGDETSCLDYYRGL